MIFPPFKRNRNILFIIVYSQLKRSTIKTQPLASFLPYRFQEVKMKKKKKKEKEKPNEYCNIESPDQGNEGEEILGETIPAQRNGIRFFMRDRQIMDVYSRISLEGEN